MQGAVVLAEVVRSGFVEGHHYGAAVALGVDGEVEYAAGDVTAPILPRSCNKPVQALGMVRAGLDLEPALLALGCGSHSGEPFHVDGVRRILAGAGLDESALLCPADYPLDDEERDALLRAGGEPAPVLMNCSGKHAAMLATCVVNGWDTTTYLDPDHPLQVAIARDLRGAGRRAGRGLGRRRLRRAAALGVADRAGAGVLAARDRDRDGGSGAPGRGGDPGAPGVRQRHPA